MGNPHAADRRKIVFLSGTRADFGKLKSLIRTLLPDPPRFEVHIFATGMHMDPKYGFTVLEFEKCNFPNVYRFINHSAGGTMDQALGTTILGFGQYVRLIQPDLIVVHGDRSEALAGAIVGSLNNVLVAHVEGGELSGTVDGLIRHSVSKMSHLHFVSNSEARRRLVQLGEDPGAVFVIGSPDVDIMNSPDLPLLEDVKAHYEIDFSEYAILAYHPVTTSLGTLRAEVREVTSAVLDSGRDWVVIYPNNDEGSELILQEYLDKFPNQPRVRMFPSLRFEAALVLLQHASLVLGNSSMGIREAPYYGTPTINVGPRQEGRTSNPQILHVAPQRDAIVAAIELAISRRNPSPVREWGHGDSHVRFRRQLEREEIWDTPVQKVFRDIPVPPIPRAPLSSDPPPAWV
ncbi:MAG: UDP-N-acetylglucosamine 2-epimerase [Deltaproteobacteria bacterium]